ncbi:uncharacterized protein LOC131994028 [Stomoxys calcitrans]|uniref:uncharacterized protein LOC131994028 n=1 Tax=Stomoxys calcitrans TaxID=35570 RepID=UPI0027E36C5B|nr:uncharacterized protein LOC131994028 [Stomoxys calcitrans]
MNPEQTPLRTKAYYKQQGQLQATERGSKDSGQSSSRRKHPTKSRRRPSETKKTPKVQLPPCYVMLERMVVEPVRRPVVAVQPMRRPTTPTVVNRVAEQPARRPTAPSARDLVAPRLVRIPAVPPVIDTIVLSSDSEEPSTPPRPFRFAPSNPATPSPTVSLIISDDSDAESIGVVAPRSANSTSPRYAESTASDTEILVPRENPRLTATRVPTPPPARLSSAIVVPTPPLQRNYAYNCQERLPDEVQPALQRHIRVALAFHVPHRQYKKVVEICGRRYRIMVNRQGKVFVMPR